MVKAMTATFLINIIPSINPENIDK